MQWVRSASEQVEALRREDRDGAGVRQVIRLLELVRPGCRRRRSLPGRVSERLAGEPLGGLLTRLFILMRYLPRVRSRGSSLR